MTIYRMLSAAGLMFLAAAALTTGACDRSRGGPGTASATPTFLDVAVVHPQQPRYRLGHNTQLYSAERYAAEVKEERYAALVRKVGDGSCHWWWKRLVGGVLQPKNRSGSWPAHMGQRAMWIWGPPPPLSASGFLSL